MGSQSVVRMYRSLITVAICISWPFLLIGAVSSDGNRDLLNTCLDGRFHKSEPGPEDALHSQCQPWSKRACCTRNTTHTTHYGKPYNFEYNHCSVKQEMSPACKRRFVQDLCFYECSPNLGPWLHKVEQKIRKEKFFEVPLCASDCDAWFKDCENDFTCTDNWGRNFDWVPEEKTKRMINQCPTDPNSSCKTFKEIYQTSQYFCENVWDQSWKYTSEDVPCMRLWFDGSNGNPNDDVAKFKVIQMGDTSDASKVQFLRVPALLILLVLGSHFWSCYSNMLISISVRSDYCASAYM